MNTVHKGTVKHRYRFWNRTLGNLMYDNTSSITSSLSLESDKISVNTGVFKPGVYRVNPYTVYSTRADKLPGGITSLDLKAADTSYRYESNLTGDIQHALVAITLPKVVKVPDMLTAKTLDKRALLSAYAQLSQSEVGGGEELGELRETLQFLRHPFKEFRDFFTNANYRNLGLLEKLLHFGKTGVWVGKKGIRRYGTDAAKVAGNTWLEFRYGLMPIVYTVQDLIKVLKAKGSRFDSDKIQSERRKSRYTYESKVPSFPTTALGQRHIIEASITDKIVAHACVQYKYTGTPTMLDRMGLSLRFLPETAWQLSRLSFLLDWWFSVEDYIGSLRYNPLVNVLGNTLGMKVERDVLVHITSAAMIGFPPDSPPAAYMGAACYQVDYFRRQCGLHLPALPVWQPEFRSVDHAIDACALLLTPILAKISKIRSK